MPKFSPNQEDYTLRDVLAGRQALRETDTQISITSPDPIRCSAPSCRRDIKDGDAYTIVTTPRGTVIWHLHCLGIKRYGDFNDPAFAQAIRQRLQQVIG